MVTSMMSSSSSGITSAETPPQKLILNVTNQQGTRVAYSIGLHTKLRKLMTSHCEKRNLDYNSVRFIYNHQEIKPRQTPAQLKMVEGDEIFVVIEQIGGGPC